jgi:hypothetical protein
MFARYIYSLCDPVILNFTYTFILNSKTSFEAHTVLKDAACCIWPLQQMWESRLQKIWILIKCMGRHNITGLWIPNVPNNDQQDTHAVVQHTFPTLTKGEISSLIASCWWASHVCIHLTQNWSEKCWWQSPILPWKESMRCSQTPDAIIAW